MKNNSIVYSLFHDSNPQTSWLVSFFDLTLPRASLLFGFISIFVLWYESILKVFLSPSFIDVAPIILMLVALLLADKKRIIFLKFHNWYLLFLLVAIFSGILAVTRGDAGFNAPLYLLVMLYFFITLLWAQAHEPKKIIWTLVVMVLPATIFGIYEYFFGNLSFSTSSLEAAAGRADSIFQGPNIFGMLMALFFVVGLFIAKEFGHKKYYVLPAIFSFALALTLSRTSWLAAIAGLVPLLGVGVRRSSLSSLAIFSGIESRIKVLFNPEFWLNSSIDGRTWAKNNGLFIASKFPIFGTGPGTYGGKFAEIYSSPVYFYGMQNGYVALLTTDNQYIAFLVQFGLFGILSFAGFLIALWFRSFRLAKLGVLARGVILSFGVMMVAANAFEFMAVSIPVAAILGVALKE